jgi:hypothetical protein
MVGCRVPPADGLKSGPPLPSQVLAELVAGDGDLLPADDVTLIVVKVL